MAEMIAVALVRSLCAYALAGGLFGIFFVLRGVQRVDHQAQGSRLGFRLLIFPGAVAFWPLLLRRWLRKTGEPPEERNSHR